MTRYKDSVIWTRLGTVLVAVLALVITLSGSKSVFGLVLYGWTAMAAGMGPLLLVYVLGMRPSQPQALAMMLTGAGVSIAWENSSFSGDLYSALPGVLASLLVCFVFRLSAKILGQP